MKNTKDVKRQHGITLISLVITVIILLILAAVAINLAVDSNGLFVKTGKAANSWNSSVSGEEQTLQDILALADEITGDKIPISQFYQNGGSIEVKFVDKNNQITQNPLAPVLGTGMTAIKWNGSAWEDTTDADTAWYDYSQSKWANARTDDGSMWVWIPRYAYEITYTLAPYTTYTQDTNTLTLTAEEFATNVNLETGEIYIADNHGYDNIYPVSELESAKQNGLYVFYTYEQLESGDYSIVLYRADRATLSSTKTTVGYSNSKGIITTSDAVVLPLEAGVETTGRYIVHPAFTTDLSLGGWENELSGIWVAKYEMSMETDGSATTTSNSTIGNVLTTDSIKMVSKPDVSSWRYIAIGNMYTNCYNYDRTNESHLMKGSEWGAVAYLSYSQYGTNAAEIAVNTSSSYITGTGGKEASSTGNETGIYDLSGGAWEYVAIYDTYGTNLSYGADNNSSNFATGTSTEYATAYENATEYYYGKTLVTRVSKTGDGIREMYSSNGISWNVDCTISVYSHWCFLQRGGFNDYGSYAGVFCSHGDIGWKHYGISFRAVLVPARLTW